MSKESKARRKQTGSHYTPTRLAEFVANKILENFDIPDRKATIRVLDPACGDGELLMSLIENWPHESRNSLSLIGIDSDRIAFQNVRYRVRNVGVSSIDLRREDFLDRVRTELRSTLPLPGSLLKSVDIIIANPPYVRTQVLGAKKAKELASDFDLSGRVDLYHAFLVAMKHCLKTDGILGVITSNRFIATKSGSRVRELLANDFEILDLYDLGDTKLFEAAVLPAVIVARRRIAPLFCKKQSTRFLKIYETHEKTFSDEADNVCAAITYRHDRVVRVGRDKYRVTTGTVDIPSSGKEPWIMVSDNERKWLQHIHECSKYKLSDITTVRVGVKTTANGVFIRRDWEDLPDSSVPESSLLHPVISSSNASKWKAKSEPERCAKILYPHYAENGKRAVIRLDDYPRAKAYFEKYRHDLQSRGYLTKANRQWYEIWVPQDPSAWKLPKIVFPDISPVPSFMYDVSGAIVDGNCYWMTFDSYDEDWLYLILGITNSALMTRFHDLSFNNKLYSGRRRYLTQYVAKYPLPDIQCPSASRVIENVKGILNGGLSQKEMFVVENQIESAVMAAYGVDYMPTD
ncbi:MAG: N-6 DNA methylase [Chloroflexi bacterium]|nr:N-6 DNA methylase [Chloroflexota bacterium]